MQQKKSANTGFTITMLYGILALYFTLIEWYDISFLSPEQKAAKKLTRFQRYWGVCKKNPWITILLSPYLLLVSLAGFFLDTCINNPILISMFAGACIGLLAGGPIGSLIGAFCGLVGFTTILSSAARALRFVLEAGIKEMRVHQGNESAESADTPCCQTKRRAY